MAAFDQLKLFKENTYFALTSSANAPLLFAIYFEVKQAEAVFRRCSSK